MILSMTGFAAAAADLPGASLTVELRSVNHRYLDLQLRLPDELRALDAVLRELLTAELKRGKVDCRIALNHALPGATTLAVNAERVALLREAATEVLRHAPGSAPLTVNAGSKSDDTAYKGELPAVATDGNDMVYIAWRDKGDDMQAETLKKSAAGGRR